MSTISRKKINKTIDGLEAILYDIFEVTEENSDSENDSSYTSDDAVASYLSLPPENFERFTMACACLELIRDIIKKHRTEEKESVDFQSFRNPLKKQRKR